MKGQAKMLFNKKDFDSKQRFSIRKLSVGVCSVLLSTLFLTFNEGQTVRASTDANAADATTTSVTSNTTNNSSDNNIDKKDDSKVEASSLPQAEKHAPIPVSEKVATQDISTQAAATETGNDTKQENKDSNQTQALQTTLKESNQSTNQTVSNQATNNTSTTLKDDAVKDTARSVNENTSTKKITPVTPHADASENITPVPWTSDMNTAVVAESDLTNIAGDFLQNEAALAAAGAKFSWVENVPKPTQADSILNAGATLNGVVRVTYADGSTKDVDVSFMVQPRVAQNPSTFYYVNNVGDAVDLNTADANGNDLSTILNTTGYGENFEFKLIGTIDTSETGIHWADISVTDNNTFNGINKVIGTRTYTVKVPYVVQSLKLRDDIPTDANGNPVINTQLSTAPKSTQAVPTNPQVAFNPVTISSNGPWMQYFYQDYALAYALGITPTINDWTAPTDLENATSNHFKVSFANLPNQKEQEIEVHYVKVPTTPDMYLYVPDGKTYLSGAGQIRQIIQQQVDSGYMNNQVKIKLADGTKLDASKLVWTKTNVVNNVTEGKYGVVFDVTVNNKLNDAGQPLIFANSVFYESVEGTIDPKTTEDFKKELNKYYQETNNTVTVDYEALGSNTWQSISAPVYVLAPTIKASKDPVVDDITNGVHNYTENELEKLVKNPATAKEIGQIVWSSNLKPNPILDNNTKWPDGTDFEWLGNDGSTTLSFDKAGEKKTGDIKITLPSGSSYTVKDITVISRANVLVKNETVEYGATLTPADLVTNKNVFPEGTTYQFVENSEPIWSKAGSYNNVKITATYTDASGEEITTPVASCAVAINDSRSIKVLAGSDVPSVDSVLSLPGNWEEHTASWTTPINTTATNEGLTMIHYPSSNLDQEIKVYVTVIPKTTAVDGQNFFTDGNKYDGTEGSIANGDNQGAILTQANGQAIDYETYVKSGAVGEQSTFAKKSASYTPTYTLSGLETNSDGSLVSGVQTATVRVSVPKGTIGAKVDADGNYYYEVNAKVNIAQPVTFEFVDEYKNDQVVGQTHSQEFIPGVNTNLNFQMAVPDGYELGNGASIPSKYTLAAFSQTTPVVKVPIHQKMHFYITFHDEDSNTNLGTVEVAGSTAGNGGYYPSINTKLTFPEGADAGDYYSVSTSGVPNGVQLVGSYNKPLTDPTADWTTPNYRWENTFSVLKALTGATMTINLKHKINKTQEKQTRTATVNYVKAKVNADGTYTQDGNVFTSAVLDVYYSRTKSEDMVTKTITYSPWLWDTNQGDKATPGYHVESGKWTSLPQHWAAVVADVPTLDGYTAATVTDKSGKPANQFVFPTWNGSDQDTSNINKESLAYTENAPIYEARPVHTVLYIPNEQQARTITAKYVIAGGDKNGQEFAPDSQIQIFYDRIGSLNVANNKITYGDWQWDNTAGDKATPGFHVISGSWQLPTNGTSSWQVNIPNSGNDYVVANLRYDVAYSTFTLAAPSYHTNDVFTSPTSDEWYTRNTLVTYYVPTSMVNKTVTRTIKISEPGQDSKTITQTAKLTRQVRVNQDDTGVVYDGFAR